MPGQGLRPLTSARLLVVPLVATAAFAVLALPVPAGTGPQVLPALALTVFTVGLWATGSLPEHITAVVFFVLALALGVAPPEVVLSGFWSSAFWLVAGGLIIGVAADRTGLGRFLAHAFVRRLSASYPRLITGIVLGAVVLAFLIPSAIGRLIILMPIILSLADKLGFAPGTRGRTGMVLATTMGSFFIPLTILPANLPNVVLAGVADSLYGLKITYGAYLLMNFPVLGALKALALVAVTCFFFNDPIPDPAAAHALRTAFSSCLTLPGQSEVRSRSSASGVKPGCPSPPKCSASRGMSSVRATSGGSRIWNPASRK